MKTPFSQENADFSLIGHELAVKSIYPHIFKVNESQLSYESTPDIPKYKRLDTELGIDKIIKVKVLGEDLRESIPFTVQERFRRLEKIPLCIRSHEEIDITITEWNNASNLPSELYKLMADLFVYGILNDDCLSFWDAIAIGCRPLKQKLINGQIEYEQKKVINPRSNQTFLCIKFQELMSKRLAVFRWNFRA